MFLAEPTPIEYNFIQLRTATGENVEKKKSERMRTPEITDTIESHPMCR